MRSRVRVPQSPPKKRGYLWYPLFFGFDRDSNNKIQPAGGRLDDGQGPIVTLQLFSLRRKVGNESPSLHAFGCGFSFWWRLGRDSKGRPQRSEGKKVSGGHFFSPWESPFGFQTHPVRMWMKTKKFGKSQREVNHHRRHRIMSPPVSFCNASELQKER